MSHANAKVRFEDGQIWHAEYDGTSDQICPRIYDSYEELREQWRKEAVQWHECTCGQEPETAEYAESYGGGGHGPVTACRTCKAIVDRSAFYQEDETYAWAPNEGLPSWWT